MVKRRQDRTCLRRSLFKKKAMAAQRIFKTVETIAYEISSLRLLCQEAVECLSLIRSKEEFNYLSLENGPVFENVSAQFLQAKRHNIFVLSEEIVNQIASKCPPDFHYKQLHILSQELHDLFLEVNNKFDDPDREKTPTPSSSSVDSDEQVPEEGPGVQEGEDV